MNIRSYFLIIIFPLFLAGCKTVSSSTPAQPENKVNPVAAANTNVELGIAYLHDNKMHEAKEKLLLAQKQAPNDPAVWYGMGYYLDMTGNTAEADRAYQKSIKLAPGKGMPENNYGVFLCRHGRYVDAIKHFMQAVKDPGYIETGEAYENAGLCALKIPNKKLAQQYFATALDQNPTLLKSLLSMAELQYEAGNDRQAAQYLERFKFYAKADYPESLLLEYRLAKKQGDETAASQAKQLLLSKFPRSEAARKLFR